MLTANRVHRLLNSLHHSPWDAFFPQRPWDSFLTAPIASPLTGRQPRIWSNEGSVVLELDLPGRQLEDLEVTTERNRLFVDVKPQSAAGEPSYLLRERGEQSGRAEFRLPFPVAAELTDVAYQHGVLRIEVKKPAEEQPRKLNVRQG